MTDFIREVDEEVRHDQFRRFLLRRWPVLVAVLVLVLAGTGGWRAYEAIRTSKAQDAGGRYLDALNFQRDGKTDEAGKIFADLGKDAPPGYALLARFSQASEVGRTDPAAGAKLFDALAADGSVDPVFKNLARLRAALMLVDTLPYADLKTRLAPLADANNGLRNSARELLAVAALKANQGEDAGRWLDAIQTDPTASASLRQRAGAMTGLVRAGSGDAVVASPAAAATAIPGLSLPSPTALPTEATPLDPVPAAAANPAPEAADTTQPAVDPAAPSATAGQAPALPPTALPTAPSGATPPTSDTVPNAAPPK